MSGNSVVYLLTVGVSLVLILFVLDLVRRRQLREQYALLWLAAGFVLLIFAVERSLVETLARVLGVYYAPSALFLLGFFFLLALNLQYAVVLSRQAERVVYMAQEVALLRQQLEELMASGVQNGRMSLPDEGFSSGKSALY